MFLGPDSIESLPDQNETQKQKDFEDLLRKIDLQFGFTQESLKVGLYQALGHKVLSRHGNVVIESGVSPADKTVPVFFIRLIGDHGTFSSQRIYANAEQVSKDLDLIEKMISELKKQSAIIPKGIDPKTFTKNAIFILNTLLDLDQRMRQATRNGSNKASSSSPS